MVSCVFRGPASLVAAPPHCVHPRPSVVELAVRFLFFPPGHRPGLQKSSPVGHRAEVAEHWILNIEYWILNRVAGSRLKVAGFRLQVAGSRLQVEGLPDLGPPTSPPP